MPKRSIHETIGILAVVIGLVFVGIEIRESSKAARAAAYQELGLATAGVWATLSESPELALSLTAATADSAFELRFDPEMNVAMAAFMFRNWRIWETVFLQVDEGLLPPEALSLFGWGGGSFDSAYDECLWRSPGAVKFKSPTFSAYVDSLRPPTGRDCTAFESRSSAAFTEWLISR